MKNLTDKQIVLGRKSVGIACILVCIILMFFNVFEYISSSTLGNGDSITWSEGFSLYNFLFNRELVVMDRKISYLREIFTFSYVIMWISFILCVVSLWVSIYGIFNKNNLFSKIGVSIFVGALAVLILINFNSKSLTDRTTVYLSSFTIFYIISLLISFFGMYSVFTIKEEK